MSLLRAAAALALALAPGVAAAGDAPVITADPAAAPPRSEGVAVLDSRGPVYAPFEDQPEARQPHGSMSVAVGTGGYRAVAGSVVVPVGKTGEVAASIAIVEGAQGRSRRP